MNISDYNSKHVSGTYYHNGRPIRYSSQIIPYVDHLKASITLNPPRTENDPVSGPTYSLTFGISTDPEKVFEKMIQHATDQMVEGVLQKVRQRISGLSSDERAYLHHLPVSEILRMNR